MTSPTYDLVIAANRLPVDKEVAPDGSVQWHRSPGGLVTAMESVMRGREAAWIGWSGDSGPAPEPFQENGMYLVPLGLTEDEVTDYYEGYSNDTLWPLYHDVIVPATFRRRWRSAYERINQRFAEAVSEVAARGATVWLHDYQLQRVPSLLRAIRPDLRIGWFNHIPFPPVEIFMQLPGRETLLEGLLGADFLGFQVRADAANFREACRRLLRSPVKGEIVTAPDGRRVRAAAVPISIDVEELRELATAPETLQRAKEIRAEMGDPEVLLLGVDRLDYTKGIRHRLKAYGELLADRRLDPKKTRLVQIATPSRERLQAYRVLRGQIEQAVGRINGDHADFGDTPVVYMRRSFPKEEMAAIYAAADVALVTPLRDGMNLVAKEFVTCARDDAALVLSEFAGAAGELKRAYLCNPHDVDRLKQTITAAIDAPPDERRKRMRAMRRAVLANDVHHWAAAFLASLRAAPELPAGEENP